MPPGMVIPPPPWAAHFSTQPEKAEKDPQKAVAIGFDFQWPLSLSCFTVGLGKKRDKISEGMGCVCFQHNM